MSTEHQKLWVHGQSAVCPLSLGNYTQQPLSPLVMPWCLKQQISKVKWWYVFSKEMENKINSLGRSCYWIMLNIGQIDRIPNTTVYSLTKNSSLYWKSQASANEFAWSCALLAWKYACQRICNVCSHSWEEKIWKTVNLVHEFIVF